MNSSDDQRSTRKIFRSPGSELEFDRFAFFSDAVFAIAMTLIIVTVEVPNVKTNQNGDLLQRLHELLPQIFSFFLSFIVLTFFWVAHHKFVAELAATDHTLIFYNMIYLAFIAFLPFPTAVLGENPAIPVAVMLYAISAGIVSFMEVVLAYIAYRHKLYTEQPSASEFLHSAIASLLPVFFFIVSVPVAIFSPSLGMMTWALTLPGESILDRIHKPISE